MCQEKESRHDDPSSHDKYDEKKKMDTFADSEAGSLQSRKGVTSRLRHKWNEKAPISDGNDEKPS